MEQSLIYGSLILSIIGIVYLLEVFDLRTSILTLPDSEKYVSCPEIEMPKRDCFLRILVPEQKTALTSYLVLQSSLSIILFVYFLCGVFGCSIYYIVLMLNPHYMRVSRQGLEIEFISETILLRLLLSGLSGILIFLMIWASTLGFGSFLPSVYEGNANPSMHNFLIMPVLSGLFLSLFFDGARQILERFFSNKGVQK